MAKGILEFDLNDNFEEELFRLAVKSKDLYFAIQSFDNHLREKAKYGDDAIAEKVRQELQEHLDEYGITLDMLS